MGLHYERDPLNHGDDRPLRGNHKTACGRYPLLPGKWRSRVGASKFAEQPKVRHLAQQIKQLYLHMYASYESGPNERPAVNVRAFWGVWGGGGGAGRGGRAGVWMGGVVH